MFYFYFEARENPETAPVVLWMTGGPGCSSELAVFYEQGPYRIKEVWHPLCCHMMLQCMVVAPCTLQQWHTPAEPDTGGQ